MHILFIPYNLHPDTLAYISFPSHHRFSHFRIQQMRYNKLTWATFKTDPGPLKLNHHKLLNSKWPRTSKMRLTVNESFETISSALSTCATRLCWFNSVFFGCIFQTSNTQNGPRSCLDDQEKGSQDKKRPWEKARLMIFHSSPQA